MSSIRQSMYHCAVNAMPSSTALRSPGDLEGEDMSSNSGPFLASAPRDGQRQSPARTQNPLPRSQHTAFLYA